MIHFSPTFGYNTMENIEEVKKAVVAGLLVEMSFRLKAADRIRRFVKKFGRRKLTRNILRDLKKKRRPHRLHPDWKDVAVDGWDGMFI